VLTIATAALGTVAMDANVPRRHLRQIRELAERVLALPVEAAAPPPETKA
jgi:hypothetical protein